jgi:SAM-dependent methyltransferase
MFNFLKKVKYWPYYLSSRGNSGYCPICMAATTFIVYNPWLRDHYKCVSCGSIPRQRAIINAINIFYPGWRGAVIHESSPAGVSSEFIRCQTMNYTFSFFFPDVKPGEYKHGARCENIEDMTFDDESFDIFITQDVLEHVVHPQRAFRDISRVLKPGGIHIFTVPLYRDLVHTRSRITDENGVIKHIMEPVFHGNPIDEGGALVTYDYGLDLPEVIETASTMTTTIFLQKDRSLGLDGEFLEVFISRN